MFRRRTADQFNIAGFAADAVPAGARGRIMIRGGLTSDEPIFYRMIKQVSQSFLYPCGFDPNYVANFLVILHPDNVVDVGINEEPPVVLEIAAKRSVAAGTPIMVSDIADVRRLCFQKITIDIADKVLYCFKVGWKFGLFFDFARPAPLDIDAMQLEIGTIFRNLAFEHVYRTLESEEITKALADAGWFPFIEILAPDFDVLVDAYAHKVGVEQADTNLVATFTRERVERITQRWWDHPPFAANRAILEAGVNAYLEDTPAGFIVCIKVLSTEIEGILRRQLLADTGAAEGGIQVLLEHLAEKGRQKSGSPSSLFLPDYFLRYLKDKVFAHFAPSSVAAATPISVGRHSVSHGAASPSAYTKRDAVQMMLVLDQIRFYGR